MIRRGDRVVRWIFLAGVAAIALWLLASTLRGPEGPRETEMPKRLRLLQVF